jgi:uncharacterized membrane protein
MSGIVAILALAGALCSAGATILIRHGLRGGTVYAGVWINLLVGTVGLWAAVLSLVPAESAHPAGLALFALSGLVGTLVGRLFRFVGIERVGASVTAAVINLSPFVATGLAILLLGEQITLAILAGTAVIVLGTTLLSASSRQVGFRPRHLVFPFLAAACFGLVAVLRKLGLSQTGPVLGLAVNVTTGLVGFTAFLLATGNRRAMGCRGASLGYFIAAGVAENVGVFLALLALKFGTVSVVAPLSGVSPIFVLLLSPVFLRGIEVLAPRVVLGTALVVAGVYLITAFPAR